MIAIVSRLFGMIGREIQFFFYVVTWRLIQIRPSAGPVDRVLWFMFVYFIFGAGLLSLALQFFMPPKRAVVTSWKVVFGYIVVMWLLNRLGETLHNND
jgi:hypothetical protein